MKIRAMKIVLQLQKNKFPNGADTKIIYSASLVGYLHCEVNINRQAGWYGNTAQATIYGMTNDDINTMSKYNDFYLTIENQMRIYAGYIDVQPNTDGTYNNGAVNNAIDQLPLIFQGAITNAGVDYNNVDRPFTINCIISLASLTSSINNLSINSPQSLSTVLSTIVNNYNSTNPNAIQYAIGNLGNATDVYVNNRHVQGANFITQITDLLNDYGYYALIRYSNNVNYIDVYLIGQGSGKVSILSSATGMIGYPVIQAIGISAREYFNPARSVGDVITLQTYYTALDSSTQGNYTVWQQNIILQTMGDYWDSNLVMYKMEIPQ